MILGKHKKLKLILNLLLVIVLIVSSIGYTVFMFKRTDAQYNTRLKETGDEVAKNIKWQMDTAVDYVEGLSEAFSKYDDIHCDEALDLLSKVGVRSRFARMWLTKVDGTAISSFNETSNGSGRDYMDQAQKGESGISPVQTSRLNGNRNVPIFAPIYHDGEVVGLVIGVFELENLLTMLDIQCFDGEGYCGIYDADNNMLVSSNENAGETVLKNKYGYSAYTGILDWDVFITFPERIIVGEIRFNAIITIVMSLIWVSVLAIFITIVFQEKNKGLKKTAQQDSLTNLLNRGTTEKIINEQLNKKGEYQSAFIVFDIDKFKSVNDLQGHITGDIMLRDTARILYENFPLSACLSRLGGDEFSIFIDNVTDRDAILKKLNQFRKQIKVTFAQNKCQSTLSIGIIFSDNKNDTFESLYHKADKAMYESKQQGGNAIVIYDGE